MAPVHKYHSKNKPPAHNIYETGHSTNRSDDFCWSCHRDKPTLNCTTCVRSYHASQFCSESKNLSTDEKRSWKCPVCVDIQKDSERMITKRLDAKDVNKLLSLVLERIKSSENFSDALMTINYSRVNQKIANPMDLRKIEQNIDDFVYRCFEAFLTDIKWIEHNVKVHRQLVFCGTSNPDKMVKYLLDMTKEEIFSIRMCHECYVGLVQNHRFDVVCKQPHLILWCKQKTYPYWPAKLMSVNTATNKVDVRYFGEKHFRAVITPKDCYLYSAERPSIWLGAHKRAFEKAQEEVNSYMKRLTEVYGSYNLAAVNTPLNANMLERHLYDTIPRAWTALGKHSIPPPIVKPNVAAATIKRRHSIASRSPRSTPPVIPSPINSGRVMTRRMSTRINLNDDDDQDVIAIGNEKMSKKVITRRQSVQVDMVSSKKRKIPNDTDISPFLTAAKKQKINNENATPISSNTTSKMKQTKSKSADEPPVFKVPEIPRKVRKPNTNTPSNNAQAKTANVQAANEMAAHKKISPQGQYSSANPRSATSAPGNILHTEHTNDLHFGSTASPTNGTNAMTDAKKDDKKVKMNYETQSTTSKLTHPTEVEAIFKKIIAKNTNKVTDCIRTSLEGMLHEILIAAESTNQLQNLKNQFATMQSQYEGRIDELKRENDVLKEQVIDLNGKLDGQSVTLCGTMRRNVELNDQLSETKLKMTVLSMELRKSQKNSNVNSDSSKAELIKLKTQHATIKKSLKDAESKMAALQVENKSLMEKNTGLNVSLQWAVKQYQDSLNRLKDVEKKSNLEKTNVFEHCQRMITDNKKHQWCAVCQKPGGRYYCSKRCEENYWRQNR